MKHKLAISVIVTTLVVLLTVPSASSGTPRKIGSGYDIEMSRMIPLRDGVELEAWIFKPSQPQSTDSSRTHAVRHRRRAPQRL